MWAGDRDMAPGATGALGLASERMASCVPATVSIELLFSSDRDIIRGSGTVGESCSTIGINVCLALSTMFAFVQALLGRSHLWQCIRTIYRAGEGPEF